MIKVHSIVAATLVKQLGEASLKVAVLESREREAPAGQRATPGALRLTKQIREARAVMAGWATLVDQVEVEDPT